MGYAIAYTIFCIRDKKREPTVTAYSLKINKEVYSKCQLHPPKGGCLSKG